MIINIVNIFNFLLLSHKKITWNYLLSVSINLTITRNFLFSIVVVQLVAVLYYTVCSWFDSGKKLKGCEPNVYNCTAMTHCSRVKKITFSWLINFNKIRWFISLYVAVNIKNSPELKSFNLLWWILFITNYMIHSS